MLQAPGGEREQCWLQGQSTVSEMIGSATAMVRIGAWFDESVFGELREAVGKYVGGNALRRCQEFVEARFPPEEEVANDEECPAVADQVQRAGDGTRGAVHGSQVAPTTCKTPVIAVAEL